MIGEVRADAREVCGHRDTDVPQMRGGPDAGPHEDGRAAVRARAEDDPRRQDLLATHQADSDRAISLHQHSVGLGLAAHREVVTLPLCRQVGEGGADAFPHSRVRGHGGGADRSGLVRVLHPSAAHLLEGLEAGAGDVRQLVVPVSADRQRPRVAVPRSVAEVRVALTSHEGRQHVRERPPVVPRHRPPVVIGRMAAQRTRRVRRGTAPEELAPGERSSHTRSIGLCCVAPVVPVGRLPAVAHVRRHIRAVVGSRLQQQHPAGPVLAEARGHDTARRAAPHHGDVVLAPP